IESVKILNLNHNALSDTIPARFFQQCSTALRVVSLAYNALQGTVLDTIWSLTNLRSLDLSHNAFVGIVPEGVGGLTSLREIHLSSNNLSGPIPSDLGDSTLLKNVALARAHRALWVKGKVAALKQSSD
ncbi:hypothetical protein KI387_033923, partial [Taxus chinensis]